MRKAILLAAAASLAIGALSLAGEKAKCPLTAQECLNKMAEHLMNKGFIGVDGKWDESAGGLRITSFMPGTKAPDAGVRVGDVLIEVNGIRATDREPYEREIFGWKPGEEIAIAVLRDGIRHEMKVELTAAPADVIAAEVGRHMIEAHSRPAGSAAQ